MAAKDTNFRENSQDFQNNFECNSTHFIAMMQKIMTQTLPILQKTLAQMSKNEDQFKVSQELQKAFIRYWQSLLSDPQRLSQMQASYWDSWSRLFQETSKKLAGQPALDIIEPELGDRRFRSTAWQENILFDFIKQSYLMTAQWLLQTIYDNEDLDPETRKRVAFYTKQYADAMAPTNFMLTNPDVLEETFRSGGENIIRGFENLLTDLEKGSGFLKVSTTDSYAFELGKDIATTKGEVVYQNELIQLIQYAPTTKNVHKTPLLIVPPWINKYYILDLRENNSLVKWAVDQGHTVFMISWVNPDASLRDKNFGDYMHQGILESLDHIEEATGEASANVLGYCIGGTLLTMTLAYLEAKGLSDCIKSATLLTTLINFEDAGELQLFTSDEEFEILQKNMAEDGILKAEYMQKTFSLLRANDLIWSFVVNNYLLGKEPMPFDLLYWNDDSTNIPADLHSFYLNCMYQENLLVEPGAIEIDDVPIDVSTITTPCYLLSTHQDHIAPWQATYKTLNMKHTSIVVGNGIVAGLTILTEQALVA